MQVDARALIAIPAVEGAATVETRAQVLRFFDKEPTRAKWLFAIMRLIAGLVERFCECTPDRAEIGFTVQQGDIVFQRFPSAILGEGDARGVSLDVPVVQIAQVSAYAQDQIHQARLAFRGLWRQSLLYPLDRRPGVPFIP